MRTVVSCLEIYDAKYLYYFSKIRMTENIHVYNYPNRISFDQLISVLVPNNRFLSLKEKQRGKDSGHIHKTNRMNNVSNQIVFSFPLLHSFISVDSVVRFPKPNICN